jgi:phosphate-selective porin OprO and OprP
MWAGSRSIAAPTGVSAVKRRSVPVALLCFSAAAPAGAQAIDGEARSWPTVRPTALVQLDATGSDLENGGHSAFNLRRGRLGLAGELSPTLAYAFNVELGGAVGDERRRLNNLWLEYRGLAPFRLRAGLFGPSQPFEGTSSSLLFLERAAPASVQRSLAGGSSALALALFANGSRWTASAAIAGDSIYGSRGRDPLTANVRFSILPRQARPLVHLGASGTIGIHSAGGQVRFSERGETRSTSRRLVDSGLVDAEGASALGFEAAAQWGQFFTQAEYYRFGIERAGREDPQFSGWYALAAWTLAGEARPYNRASGSFESPRAAAPFAPTRGQWGALELAARLSRLDLDDPGTIRGGSQRVLSLVLNWYPERRLRVQGSVQHVKAQQEPGPARDFRLFSLRTQYSL